MGTVAISGSVNYSNGSDSIQRSFGGSYSNTGEPRTSGVQTIGTSEEQLVLGDVTSVGWVVIRNLDATNYVSIGTTTGQLGMKLKAGESYAFRSSTNNIYAQANTAACKVAYDIFSD